MCIMDNIGRALILSLCFSSDIWFLKYEYRSTKLKNGRRRRQVVDVELPSTSSGFHDEFSSECAEEVCLSAEISGRRRGSEMDVHYGSEHDLMLSSRWLMSKRLLLMFLVLLHGIGGSEASPRANSNKQFISQLDEGQFEIVHPFQMRENKERIGIDTHNYFLNASAHFKHITIVIRSTVVFGGKQRLKLNLQLDDHLFYNETQFRKLTEEGDDFMTYRVENCYYQGTVNGDSNTFVSISTCNGLRGIIAFDNGTALGIWPLDGGDRTRRHPHVLYKVKWTRDASCGATTAPVQSAGGQMARRFVKRDITRQTKHIELAVIGDHRFVKDLNLTEDEAVEFMLEAVNMADEILTRDLNIRLSVVYSEVWLDAQRIDIHPDISRTLSGALDYVNGHLYPIEKDVSLVFTGGFFANNEMLTGSFNSICTARAVGVVKAIDDYSVDKAAQFIAHVIAHILGVDHDSRDCVCSNNLPCVMNSQVGAMEAGFSWQFSKCSVAQMHNLLQASPNIQCLLNRPFQSSSLHQCGNGKVDAGEECDCGRRDECTDPCCDPITCTLRAHAKCAAHQPCCDRCELRKPGHVCRKSRSVCDVAETCDGESGDCPVDGYLVDGIACGHNGQCWKGNCSDPDQQCQSLWGRDATAAEDSCYSNNEKGAEYGNCGRDRNGNFIACQNENRKCGLLQCKNGRTSPVSANLTSFNFQFLKDGKQMQCKSITNIGVGLVDDGTSCGNGRVCVEGTCLPLAQVSPPVHCPSNNLALQCSAHGDCTTTQTCICYDGWSGAACDQKTNTTRKIIFGNSHYGRRENEGFNLVVPGIRVTKAWEETVLLVGILAIFGLFLFLLLICLLFCYRRRSKDPFNPPVSSTKVDESFQDDGNRVIKFGPTPSWTKEKRSRKKQKHIYGQLHRINEANEEKDNMSLRSRESQPMNPASNRSLNGSSINALLINEPYQLQRQLHDDQMDFEVPMYEGGYGENKIYADGIGSAIDRATSSPLLGTEYGRRTFHDGLLMTRDGYGSGSGLRSPASNYEPDLLNSGPIPLYASNYNRHRVAPPGRNGSPSGSASSQNGSTSGRYTGGIGSGHLKLSSIQAIMRKVENENSGGSGSDREMNDELFTHNHLTDQALPDPPPASADSGNAGSLRDSPSLFSDTFKLDVNS
ncbi:unnamed protein product [Bursaphelenchus okinawaensis]|uniref:Disintegrin domain-containing protein n=1 Tax=Bursaphelenchus okinawaensis TaxID=465554 RepID=A0A811KGD1_9BILA|nr:unnamed protein product [Bursaphelenchus okinawaensis]CAG9102394.1 unnamed protein product [Bursaphelenchus okinawaensis]